MSAQQHTYFLFMEERYKPDYSGKHWVPHYWHVKVDDGVDRIFVREEVLTIEVPDDFNPVPIQVAALEKQKREARDAFMRRVAEIDEQISKLTCIEFAGGEA